MIFGVENRIDTGVIPYERPWKSDLTVIFLQLCEARKKSEKINTEGTSPCFPVGHGCTVVGWGDRAVVAFAQC